MVEPPPEKPFACTIEDCGMSFTNEDHLNVHIKKHDMALQLGLGQKGAAFLADQTPTPTRFIRNCEEVGLFQDLQNVNPFEEGFKRAIENKGGCLSLENVVVSATLDDALHTPQMMFPQLPDNTDAIICDNGIKPNDQSVTVATISRVLGAQDLVLERSQSTFTNFIKIHSNLDIRNENNCNFIQESNGIPAIISQKSIEYTIDGIVDVPAEQEKQIQGAEKNVLLKTLQNNFTSSNNTEQLKRSQDVMANKKSTSNNNCKKKKTSHEDSSQNFGAMIKLPNGELVRMEEVDDNVNEEKNIIKQKIKECIEKKKTSVVNPNLINSILGPVCNVHEAIPNKAQFNNLIYKPGILVPVTVVKPNKIPIPVDKYSKIIKKPEKKKKPLRTDTDTNVEKINLSQCINNIINSVDKSNNVSKLLELIKNNRLMQVNNDDRDNQVVLYVDGNSKKNSVNGEVALSTLNDKRKSVNAAAQRYRQRLKRERLAQVAEIRNLKEQISTLTNRLNNSKTEIVILKGLICEHFNGCPNTGDFTGLNKWISHVCNNCRPNITSEEFQFNICTMED